MRSLAAGRRANSNNSRQSAVPGFNFSRKEKHMRKLSAAVLIAAALGVGMTHAQNVPAPSVKAVQPGLIEVTGPYVNDLYGAGVQKLTATPTNIEVHSPWGNINFGWPKDVKPVAFTIETAKNGGVQISAPGFTEANKADYRAAIAAVVPMAISKSQAQRDSKKK